MKFKRGEISFFPKNFVGQVTIFIIIGIVIIGLAVLFFVFKDSIIKQQIPSEIQPAYSAFVFCVQENTQEGIRILESQGGYITPPEFESGSEYMPFSSQLSFFGTPIPYWYYVSGNNLQRQQVPSQTEMENQLAEFVDDTITRCSLKDYSSQGYTFSFGKPSSTVKINTGDVEVDLNMDLSMTLNEETTSVTNHQITVASNLGKLYYSAKKVYDYEQKNLFLEKYGVDVLRLYAPVDGAELTCSPMTWNADKIFNDVEGALEQNVYSLKAGTNSVVETKDDKYFYTEIGVDEEVTFLNSKNWPHTFEVSPSDDSFLIANPVGNQEGLGVLGFCYVAYHFVYDVKYPVLVQVKKGDEIFQFPVAVVIQGNVAREAYTSNEIVSKTSQEICKFKNSDIRVNLFDNNYNRLDGQIYFECAGEGCYIDEVSNGELVSKVPQCVNGYLTAKSDGFESSKQLFSSINSSEVTFVMSKVYNKNVKLYLDGSTYSGNALIVFSSDKLSKSVVYPEQKEVMLSEGAYNVSVYVYKNSTLKLEAQTETQCTEVLKSGIAGTLGFTEKKCFDIEVPASIITNALSGGGKKNIYAMDSELKSSGSIEVRASSFPAPTTLKQVQENYLLFDSEKVEVDFT